MERNEFYNQDMNILRKLGCELGIINRLSDSLDKIDIAFVWWWTWLKWLGPKLKRSGIPIIATATLDPLD